MTIETFDPLGKWEFQVRDQVGSRLSVEFKSDGSFQMIQRVGRFEVPAVGLWKYTLATQRLVLNGTVNKTQPFELALALVGQFPGGFSAVGGDGVQYLLTREEGPALQGSSTTSPGQDAAPAPVSQGTEPSPTPQMNLPRELRVRLVEIFLKPELTVTFSGRTSLLDGIDGASSLARDPAIQRHDLELIIRQVASLRRTPAGDIPLVILIDNAMPYVQMFEAGSELGKLREEVVKLHSA